MFRLASADCVKLTPLDKAAAGRRRWTVKHDEQEKADLKAAAHTSHIPPWPFARVSQNGNPSFYVACQLIAECMEIEGGRKRRSLRAVLKHAKSLK